MQTKYRVLAGAVALVVGLTLAACGEGDRGAGTLEVASIPTAEVVVDGTSHGNTPAIITLDAGQHDVVLRRDLFKSHEATVDLLSEQTTQVEAVLVASDPVDPEVIRILAEASDIEFEPFEEPERHRGAGGSDALVLLLWPQKDVRLVGLDNFGIEASADYDSEDGDHDDGYIEFRRKRDVLYRERFQPEHVMTVAPIPADVKAALKAGDTVTWGVFFVNKRDNVTAKFKVVKGTKADRALEKLAKRSHYRRQPPITQALMRAQLLQNHRLYTEALLANLTVVQDFPAASQPYRGIVTSLRRMDAKDSELWAISAPFAGGRGGRARASQAGSGSGTTASRVPGAGAPAVPLRHYDPSVAMRARPKPLGAGDAVRPGIRPVPEPGGVPTPPMPPMPTPPVADEPATAVPPGPQAGEAARRAEELAVQAAEAREQLEGLHSEAVNARREADEAHRAAMDAMSGIGVAEQALQEAEQEAEADPSEENVAKLEAAQAALEKAQGDYRDATEKAAEAAQHAGQAEDDVARGEKDATRLEREAKEARQQAEAAGGMGLPLEPRGTDPEVAIRRARERLEGLHGEAESARREADEAHRAAMDAMSGIGVAEQALLEAEQEAEADPSEENVVKLEAAQAALEKARDDHRDATENAAEAAQRAGQAEDDVARGEKEIMRLRQEAAEAAGGMGLPVEPRGIDPEVVVREAWERLEGLHADAANAHEMADAAQGVVDDAMRGIEASEQAVLEAARVAEADPSEENTAKLEAAHAALEKAQGEHRDAAEKAADAAQRADQADEEVRLGEKEALRLKQEAAEAGAEGR